MQLKSLTTKVSSLFSHYTFPLWWLILGWLQCLSAHIKSYAKNTEQIDLGGSSYILDIENTGSSDRIGGKLDTFTTERRRCEGFPITKPVHYIWYHASVQWLSLDTILCPYSQRYCFQELHISTSWSSTPVVPHHPQRHPMAQLLLGFPHLFLLRGKEISIGWVVYKQNPSHLRFIEKILTKAKAFLSSAESVNRHLNFINSHE